MVWSEDQKPIASQIWFFGAGTSLVRVAKIPGMHALSNILYGEMLSVMNIQSSCGRSSVGIIAQTHELLIICLSPVPILGCAVHSSTVPSNVFYTAYFSLIQFNTLVFVLTLIRAVRERTWLVCSPIFSRFKLYPVQIKLLRHHSSLSSSETALSTIP